MRVMWQSHGMAKMANLHDTFALREALDKINSQIRYKPYDDVVWPSVRALDGDGTTVYHAIQMVIRVHSALVCLPYNSYQKPYNTVMAHSPSHGMELNDTSLGKPWSQTQLIDIQIKSEEENDTWPTARSCRILMTYHSLSTGQDVSFQSFSSHVKH